MKVILAGDWHSSIHELPLSKAMERAGVTVVPFKWHHYFSGQRNLVENILLKVQNKILAGPIIDTINSDLLDLVRIESPDILFVYRGTHIAGPTFIKIREIQPRIKIAVYNNDDPFSARYGPFLWRLFKSSLPHSDIAFAYRHKNLDDFQNAGAPRAELLRSWFIPELNLPVKPTVEQLVEYGGDIVFIGHYEDDGRDEAIARLIENQINVRLFGHIDRRSSGWGKILAKHKSLSKLKGVRPLWGREYNLALNCSSMALCFLSKLNQDTYTRRCFEIPAAGTVLVSERTSDLESLFVSDEEALYFSDSSELVDKVLKLKNDPIRTAKMKERILKKVWEDGHDVNSRGKFILKIISEIK